jgi:Trehalase
MSDTPVQNNYVPEELSIPSPWPYPLRPWTRPVHYKDLVFPDPLVKENKFIGIMPDRAYTKQLGDCRELLPKPFWEGHQAQVDGYWKAWDLAFRNCKRAPVDTGFITPFIDTAFNDCLFMWDSVFILMFARYGERAFSFQKTLDNFYTKQHRDGFICREIREGTGEDHFHNSDPNSTGPNVMPWSEWEYFQQFGDHERLAAVFPVLLAYYHWFRKNRTWPDGTYWSTGWSNGMDNQSRVSPNVSPKWDHDHLSWIDTTAQAVLAAKILVQMAAVLGREADAADLQPEIEHLTQHVNTHMWNEELGFYVDRRRDGSVSNVKSIAGFWTLISGIASPDRQARLFAHLTDPKTFGRPHPIPSISADNPNYDGHNGRYWLGSVWPSTNYIVLRGLTANGADALAHDLGRRHLDYVTQVFVETGTYWENYAPERAAPGKPALPNLVGWGGVGPIAVFLEYVIGLRPDFSRKVLVWDIRLLEAHGVDDYPIGSDTTLNLSVAARANASDEPVVSIISNQRLTLELVWEGGKRTVEVMPAVQ